MLPLFGLSIIVCLFCCTCCYCAAYSHQTKPHAALLELSLAQPELSVISNTQEERSHPSPTPVCPQAVIDSCLSHLCYSDNNNSMSPPRGPPLRILCLHDAGSNANRLQARLRKLGDRLLDHHNIELVYINGALVVGGDNDGDATNITDAMEDGIPLHNNSNANYDDTLRCWWQTTDEHPYLGLDASLLLVQHVWQSWASFSGILGVGQGAALAALATLWLWRNNDTNEGPTGRAPPQCAIFIDGYTVLPEDMPLISIQQLEALHILPSNDTTDDHDETLVQVIPTATAVSTTETVAMTRLVTQMGGRTHVRQVAETWYSTDCLNRMGRYLVQHKKLAVHRNENSHNVTALQHALIATEQEAAALVHQHALRAPPPSLMAVIDRSVAGWTDGPKRRDPAGGGAPCPADFVLPVHKRGEASEEASNNNRPRLA